MSDFENKTKNKCDPCYNPSRIVVGPIVTLSDQTEKMVMDYIQEVQNNNSSLNRQEGGDHYKDFVIQPGDFCQKNSLRAYESNIVKYACRHQGKGKHKDILKLIHYAEMLFEFDYPEEYKKYKESKK